MSLPAKRLTALKHAIYSLSDIPDQEWEYFSRQIRECGYNPNDLLVRAGEPMRDFFFIISGLVRYYYSTENGKEFNLIISEFGEGFYTLLKMLKSKDFATSYHDNEIGLIVQPGIATHYVF